MIFHLAQSVLPVPFRFYAPKRKLEKKSNLDSILGRFSKLEIAVVNRVLSFSITPSRNLKKLSCQERFFLLGSVYNLFLKLIWSMMKYSIPFFTSCDLELSLFYNLHAIFRIQFEKKEQPKKCEVSFKNFLIWHSRIF